MEGKTCQKSLDVISALYDNFVLCFFILLLKYLLQILILIQECFKSKLIHRFLILSCNLHWNYTPVMGVLWLLTNTQVNIVRVLQWLWVFSLWFFSFVH